MNTIIRIKLIPLEVARQAEAVNELRLSLLHAAEAKLHLHRARNVLPGDQPHLKRVLESLSAWLQLPNGNLDIDSPFSFGIWPSGR